MGQGTINESLTERFRPKKLNDLIGNPEAIKRLVKAVEEKEPCIVHGPPGIGKTSAVYAIANEKNYKVLELNASDQRRAEDMERIIRQVSSNTFVPTIFLLDEIDGAESFKSIEKCVNNTRNPLVLICNDFYKVQRKAKKLTQVCKTIRFRRPWITQVSKLIEHIENRTGKKADYTNITNDVRNSILCAFYGGQKNRKNDDFKVMEDFFRKGETVQLKQKHLLWLLDNGHENFKGKKLYEFYQFLALVSITKRFNSLKHFNSGKGRAKYPRYLKRKKMFKKTKKKENK